MIRALKNLRSEFIVFCLVVCVALAVLIVGAPPVLLAAIWSGIAGYLLKAAVEAIEGRGPV